MSRGPARLTLTVQYAVAPRGLPARALLGRWVRAALLPTTRRAVITLRFVGRAEGVELNRRYRSRRHATNVLSFVYDDERGKCGGDIVLCAPVLRREAAAQGKPVTAHCAHLVVHGVLHLQGADHEYTDEAARMEARESAILARLGFPDPYQSRGDDALPRR
ncbi:MAG TPA: rRNA maturation RNase YbeY [Casimicrobiaceae bacterium]|jgi:probable rRNA maturation factor|nr:rRNA maturation RNase YbeY [Casimicrobiaceae bacterium]